MTEYLLYVSLVFIPIACWIAHLLKQDGFDIKKIILVLVLSYLMITAFPFSVQHLGAGITILCYSAMFAVLIMVMCKPELFNLPGQSGELGSELAGKSALTVPGGETTVFAVTSPAGKTRSMEITPAASVESLDMPKQISSIAEEVPASEAIPAGENVLPIESVPLDEIPNSGINDQNLDRVSVQAIPEPEPPAAVIDENLAGLPNTDIEAPQAVHDRENHDDIQVRELLFADDCSPDLSESAIAGSAPEHQAAVSEGSTEKQASVEADNSPAEAAVDDNRETKDNQNQDTMVFPDAASPADDSQAATCQAELADWIERGFEAKANNDLAEAAECFTRALETSSDDELKYLLGMELVSILQNTGNYEQAESILDDLIQTISAQPAMIMELSKQKQYISLLAGELNRLGLAGTPIYEVPRFVRIKVNEKMLA